MTTDRYQRGLAKIMEYMPPGGGASHQQIADELENLAPDVPRYMVEFAFGDIYSRPGLTKQEQTFVTVASLVTLGTEPQIELHINTAITVGLTQDQIVSSLIHLLPYICFPRVLNALSIAARVFSERTPSPAPVEWQSSRRDGFR